MSGRFVAVLAACASLLCGCALHHSEPLPMSADLAPLPSLTVPAASFGLPGLRPAPFDPARGLTETNIMTLPDPQLAGGMSWSAVRTGYDAAARAR